MNEIWKNIKGFEGLYQVSNLGRVKSFKRSGNKHTIIMKPINVKGYLAVWLSKNNKRKRYSIHRLVAKAFLENEKKQVNHINGIKTDNRLKNLEWATRSENQLHSYANGLQKPRYGENNNLSKFSEKDIRDMRKLDKFFSKKELSIIFDTCLKNVYKIINRESWRHIL